jgi:hypothetical protein
MKNEAYPPSPTPISKEMTKVTKLGGFETRPYFFASYALFAVKFLASLFGVFLLAALPHCALCGNEREPPCLKLI